MKKAVLALLAIVPAVLGLAAGTASAAPWGPPPPPPPAVQIFDHPNFGGAQNSLPAPGGCAQIPHTWSAQNPTWKNVYFYPSGNCTGNPALVPAGAINPHFPNVEQSIAPAP